MKIKQIKHHVAASQEDGQVCTVPCVLAWAEVTGGNLLGLFDRSSPNLCLPFLFPDYRECDLSHSTKD